MKRNLCLILFLMIVSAEWVAAQQKGEYVHYKLGKEYKKEERYEEAVEEFKKVLSNYPEHYNAYMNIAQIRYAQGRYRLAIYNLKKALEYNPGWSKAKKLIASAYEKNGQPNNALKELQEYIQFCDPAEKDSIQSEIDRLVSELKGEEPQKDSDTGDSEAADEPKKKEGKGESQAGKSLSAAQKKEGAQSRSASERTGADLEFRRGVKAYNEGVAEGNSDKIKKALDHMKRTLELQPGHYGAYYYAGAIRRHWGQNDMAIINFNKSVPYKELGYNAHFYLGKLYGEKEKYKDAIEHLKKYTRKTDYKPGIREAQSIIKEYQRALKAEKKDTLEVDEQKLGHRGIQDEISKISKPVPLRTLDIRIDSMLVMKVLDTVTDKGQEMLEAVHSFRDNKFDKAIQGFNSLLNKYSRGKIVPMLLYNLGVSYYKLENWEYAMNQFDNLLNRYPNSEPVPDALFLKGVILSRQGKNKAANRLFRNFIKKYKNHALKGKAYEKLGDIYSDQHNGKKAADSYSLAAKNAERPLDKVFALFKLGKSYLKIGNNKGALSSFESAVETGEKNGLKDRVPASLYTIGDIYYKAENYKEALSYYKKAVRKYPKYEDSPWGLFQIGSSYKKLSQYEKAVDQYKKLQKKYPESYWAEQAEWRIKDAVWANQYKGVME